MEQTTTELPRGNRRSSQRIDAFLPARVGLGGRAYQGEVVDISAGGMCVKLDGLPQEGAVVEVLVEFPGDNEVATMAEVVRVVDGNATLVGLRYIDVPQEFLELAWDFVTQHATTH